MFKQFILLISLFLITFYSNAQIQGQFIDDRAPCFMKSLNRLGQQYVEWECDERDNIISCNDKLISDPTTQIVRNRRTGAPFTGDCETCFRNGIRKYILHFVNGQLDGENTTYFRSGCPRVSRNYVQGAKTGTWTFYNDTSGLMISQVQYLNGIKNGKAIYFKQHKTGTDQVAITVNGTQHTITYNTYDNDTLRVENYKMGKLDGIKEVYYWPGSKLKKKIEYSNGLMNGTFLKYNKDGKLLMELNFKNGHKNGLCKYYYNNGVLLKTENWTNGKKDGTFKVFYIEGNIQTVENYRNGLKDGVFKIFNPDGKLMSLQTFNNGKKDGEFIDYYPNSTVKREAYYKRDKLIEEHVYDKYGNEIRTVGEPAKKQMEDDKIPTDK